MDSNANTDLDQILWSRKDMDEPIIENDLESADHIQTFVIHLFRSETGREMALRSRLDVTTGGAVVVTSGLISFAFTSPDVSHVILLANVILIFVFLLVEARRYQMYAKLKYRVRYIERDYIAPLINRISTEPQKIAYQPHIDPSLVNSLLEHKSPISRLEAIARRLRSIYIYLFGVIYVVWLDKILSGRTDQPWLDYINQQAKVSHASGAVIFLLFTTVVLVALVLSLRVSRFNDQQLGIGDLEDE